MLTKEFVLVISLFGNLLTINTADAFSGRVVNGTDSDISRYPYAVSIRRANGNHTCVGTLISPSWLLTSGVCIFRPSEGGTPPDEQYTIQHSATIISPIATVNVSQIAETIVHRNFYPFPNNSYIHDITLIRLTEPVYISKYAILPSQFSDIADGTPSTIIGWGRNYTEGPIQNTLQEAEVSIFSDEECRNRHAEIIHPSHICAGLPDGGRGHCYGDAGAPLLVNGIQVGLASWVYGECAERPSVYTQISYYREWIRQISMV